MWLGTSVSMTQHDVIFSIILYVHISCSSSIITKRHCYNILTYSYSVISAAPPRVQIIVSLTVHNWIITSVLVGSRSAAAAAAGCRRMNRCLPLHAAWLSYYSIYTGQKLPDVLPGAYTVDFLHSKASGVSLIVSMYLLMKLGKVKFIYS